MTLSPAGGMGLFIPIRSNFNEFYYVTSSLNIRKVFSKYGGLGVFNHAVLSIQRSS